MLDPLHITIPAQPITNGEAFNNLQHQGIGNFIFH